MVNKLFFNSTDCVDLVAHSAKLSLSTLGPPLAINSEKFLIDAIERKWRLTDALMYVLKYQGSSQDESSQYYYFEVLLRSKAHIIAVSGT